MDVDDLQEWQRALAGDGRAFADLFRRHQPRVARQLWRFLSSSADVDDAVAVVFLEAWRRRDTVRLVEGSVLPWLLVTAMHVASNLQRASRRYRTALQKLPQATVERDPLEVVQDREVLRALRGLPMKEREVLALCVLDGWSEKDAAAVLDVPPGTVKSRLHRAKRRLADSLGPVRDSIENGVTHGLGE